MPIEKYKLWKASVRKQASMGTAKSPPLCLLPRWFYMHKSRVLVSWLQHIPAVSKVFRVLCHSRKLSFPTKPKRLSVVPCNTLDCFLPKSLNTVDLGTVGQRGMYEEQGDFSLLANSSTQVRDWNTSSRVNTWAFEYLEETWVSWCGLCRSVQTQPLGLETWLRG